MKSISVDTIFLSCLLWRHFPKNIWHFVSIENHMKCAHTGIDKIVHNRTDNCTPNFTPNFSYNFTYNFIQIFHHISYFIHNFTDNFSHSLSHRIWLTISHKISHTISHFSQSGARVDGSAPEWRARLQQCSPSQLRPSFRPRHSLPFIPRTHR